MITTGIAQDRESNDATGRDALMARYRAVRAASEALCKPLSIEDYGLQAMPDVSPPKWHLAHTSWFFETFLLLPFQTGYTSHQRLFDHLFNSYYETVGTPFPRTQRGQLSRPTVAQVYDYRRAVDEAMIRLIADSPAAQWSEVARRVTLGLNHEQQHQELLLTDIKFNLSVNPLRPSYDAAIPFQDGEPTPLAWRDYPGGVIEIGHSGETFSFDNETPRHRVYLDSYALASRPVTNGEYLAFMEDDGYARAEFWLADGWRTVSERNWTAPLYWEPIGEEWWYFTFAGMKPVDMNAPVCHISFYEADAYARWTGKRLPTEAEWENAAAREPISGNFADSGTYHPVGGVDGGRVITQIYGDVWEWTGSSYVAYPGFKPLAGSLGEYNGKFMANQMVLRGGSCATPADHIRATYRNFFYPPDRWQFSGIRLAEDR